MPAGICIVSVVPRLDAIFARACRDAFGLRPLFATPDAIGIPLGRYPRGRIGADRLVNALAAFQIEGGAAIAVDIGTAITFDAINSRGRFLGGAIAPGPELMARALHEMTARLPLVKISIPRRAIGGDTESCMRAGILTGCAGMIDRVVESMSSEMGGRPAVVATGGMARFIAPRARTICRADPDLTLRGLRAVWERNCIKSPSKARKP